MAASDVNAVYPSRPIPLLIMDDYDNSKWTIPEDARTALHAIEKPLTVVSIVGKYRGGKSYLMNILAGKHGFTIGSTVQSMTKGIWMWPRPHPKDKDRCLLLLDTEGLHDAEKGDSNNDIQLFVFALLMSGCLMYNIKGAIDNSFIEELQMVTELADRIKVKKNKSEDDGDEEELTSFFPKLAVVVRDFHLELTHDGKKITSDQYLEKALKLKNGTSKKVLNFNAPRMCIRQYFPEPKCFLLPKPVADDKKIRQLSKLPKEELQPEFRKKSEEMAEYILTTIQSMVIDGNIVYGPGFSIILEEYAKAVNDKQIPCIESAVDSLRRQEHLRALRQSLETYRIGMIADIEGKLPRSTEELEDMHSKNKRKSDEEYRHIVRIEEEAKEHVKQIEDEFQDFVAQNNDESMKASKTAVEKYFQPISEKIKTEAYCCKGGYKAFTDDLLKSKAQYEDLPRLGPLKPSVLKEKEESLKQTSEFILQSDKALKEKEKELLRAKEEQQRAEEQIKKQNEQLQEERRKQERIRKEHIEMMEKAKQDFEKQFKAKDEEQKQATEAVRLEMEKLRSEGLKQQADLMQKQLEAAQKEREYRHLEAEKRREEFNLTFMMMTRQHHATTRQHEERVETNQRLHHDEMKDQDKTLMHDGVKETLNTNERNRNQIRDYDDKGAENSLDVSCAKQYHSKRVNAIFSHEAHDYSYVNGTPETEEVIQCNDHEGETSRNPNLSKVMTIGYSNGGILPQTGSSDICSNHFDRTQQIKAAEGIHRRDEREEDEDKQFLLSLTSTFRVLPRNTRLALRRCLQDACISAEQGLLTMPNLSVQYNNLPPRK